MERPSQNLILMATAVLVSSRSTATRAKVGCVLAREGRVISTGYNGTLPGDPNACESETGETLPTVRHAEENALGHCLREGLVPRGCEAFLTLSPCYHCSALLIYSGISKVYYLERYRVDSPLAYLESHGVEVEQIDKKSVFSLLPSLQELVK